MDRSAAIFIDGLGAACCHLRHPEPAPGRHLRAPLSSASAVALEDIAAELEQSKSNVSVNIRGGPRVRRRALQRMAAARLPPEDRPELRGLSMNFPLLVAGSLGLLGAGIHGVAGESLVVRRLSPGGLPSSPFGGPGMTKTMIRAAWHMTTVAFLTVGSALVLSGSVLHGDTARAIGLVAAGESTGFAALAVGRAFARASRALRV